MKKKEIILVVAAFMIFIIYMVCMHHKRAMAMKESVNGLGQVDSIEYTRGVVYVHIRYKYGGKVFQNVCSIESMEIADSLKLGRDVRIRVSKEMPSKYIEYIGVYTPVE
ncbi:hypothetical protein [Mucilaginibacter aquariorum]|uniref:DUF3592 domain-containing protein n=1 Tax=Mucilaginibacter aquariorum TaxID=2967225 RepID=A0ABT1T0M2_9SPHI|nr:hypothetical protein [Mucilaginibacter aquariorum]MCQ6958155.1 hypothetical protein [Mucilaginibacter aquariorum]